jgi:hypothetical protein
MYHNIYSISIYKNEISAQIVPLATMQLPHPASAGTFYLLCLLLCKDDYPIIMQCHQNIIPIIRT